MKYICIIAICHLLIGTIACSNKSSERFEKGSAAFSNINEDGTPALINYRSFQNADKTWGFTIIINNVPSRNYNTIPYKKAQSGFSSKDEAESVGGLFVKLIRKGVQSPVLTKNMLDSLGIKIDNDM
jgi:hypothetical protein